MSLARVIAAVTEGAGLSEYYLSYIYLCFRKHLNMIQYVVCLCSSCGLAEELEQESKGKQKPDLPKSACGSVSIFRIL